MAKHWNCLMFCDGMLYSDFGWPWRSLVQSPMHLIGASSFSPVQHNHNVFILLVLSSTNQCYSDLHIIHWVCEELQVTPEAQLMTQLTYLGIQTNSVEEALQLSTEKLYRLKANCATVERQEGVNAKGARVSNWPTDPCLQCGFSLCISPMDDRPAHSHRSSRIMESPPLPRLNKKFMIDLA